MNEVTKRLGNCWVHHKIGVSMMGNENLLFTVEIMLHKHPKSLKRISFVGQR